MTAPYEIWLREGQIDVKLELACLKASTHISSTWCRSARAVSRSIVLLATEAHLLSIDMGAQGIAALTAGRLRLVDLASQVDGGE